jgi:hypothetical protein
MTTQTCGKAYRLEDPGQGLFLVTDNLYQSLFWRRA